MPSLRQAPNVGRNFNNTLRMRHVIIILLTLISSQSLYCQSHDQIGQLRLLNAKIISVDSVEENFCGQLSNATRLTILARTRVQLSCNYGDPSQNIYDTVNNKVYLYYSDDSNGALYKAIVGDISSYLVEQEAWANTYTKGADIAYLDKSFFVTGGVTVPFIWTGAERIGDYKLFYFNKHAYKIVLLKSDGFGCLSSFIYANMYFTKDGKKFDLGECIRSIKLAKQIASRK
jgi:hypothetical protein